MAPPRAPHRAPHRATILDGKAIAARLRAGLAGRVAGLGYRPGLVVVRVGEDPASGVYVRNKDRAAQEAGFASRTRHLPESPPEAELLAVIRRLNADGEGGRHPGAAPAAAAHPRREAVIAAVTRPRTPDGFHPLNAGRLASGPGRASFPARRAA
jgi:methylenetetrahydrofolate dehydrogenase (NADP+)/methenyltetrahydrofolate cyclohydrolase